MWFIVPMLFIAGSLFINYNLSWIFFFQLFLLTIPYSLFLYGINDFYDHDSDTINPRKKLLEGVRHKNSDYQLILRWSFIFALLLLLSSILSFNYINLIGMLSLLFFSYFYSAPPLRFRVHPPLDSFSNGAIFFSVFVIIMSFNTGEFFIPLNIYYLLALVISFHAFSTIMDYSPDKVAGHKTFSTVFGIRVTSFFSFFLCSSILLFARFSHGVIHYSVLLFSLFFLLVVFFPYEFLARIISWFLLLSSLLIVLLLFLS